MRSGWIVLIVALLLLGQLASVVLEVGGTTPTSTTDGNYSLHVRNTVSGDHGFVTTDDVNTTGMMCLTLWEAPCAPVSYTNRTDEIQASLYVSSVQFQQPFIANLDANRVFSLNLTNYDCYLSLAVYRSDKGVFLESTGQKANITRYWTTNSWLQLEAHINQTSYTTQSGTFIQHSVQSYLNGTKVGDTMLSPRVCSVNSYAGPASGRAGIRIGTSSLAEIYVDSIHLIISGQLRYSQGFENGLTGFTIDRTGQSTVDTTFFGSGLGKTSTQTTLFMTPSSLIPVNQTNLSGAVNFKTAPIVNVKAYPNVLMHGTLYDLTQKKGVSSATVVLEIATFSQVSLTNQLGTLIVPGVFQPLGTTTTDQNGNFSVTWKPVQAPLYSYWIVRARFDGNSALFGSLTYTIVNSVGPVSVQLTIYFSTYVGITGLQVNIYGNLTGAENRPIGGESIALTYAVGAVGGPITSVKTGSDGKYSAVWKPSATGNYTLQALWNGNATYYGLTTTSSPLIVGDSFAQAGQFVVQNSIPLSLIGAAGLFGFLLWSNMRSARRKRRVKQPPIGKVSYISREDKLGRHATLQTHASPRAPADTVGGHAASFHPLSLQPRSRSERVDNCRQFRERDQVCRDDNGLLREHDLALPHTALLCLEDRLLLYLTVTESFTIPSWRHCQFEGREETGFPRRCKKCMYRFCERHLNGHWAKCPFK